MGAEDIPAADIGPATVARPRATVAAAELDGEIVLFDEVTGRLHALDPIATVVWGCLDGRVTLADIAGGLAEEFGADVAVVRADVLRLVRELGAQGVLEGIAGDPELLAEEPVEEEEVLSDDSAGC